MYMMCAENASLFPWFSLMIAWTTRLFFLLVFIYVRAKRWLCNYSGAKGKSVVTQLAPIGFYNDHLRQIFVCLPPVERWSFISLYHALSLLYCTLWLTRLFSDSKDFSRFFFFFAFSSSLIGYLEYLTFATGICPRFSPVACVLIGLLCCLDYATFSRVCHCDLRFDWCIVFFVGKAIGFCLVLLWGRLG